MVKRLSIYAAAVLLAAAISGCSRVELPSNESGIASTIGQRLAVSVVASNGDATRAIYSDGVAKWTAGETIGVVAACDGSFTDSDFQPFTGTNESTSASAAFEGMLCDGGEGDYRLYAISPYQPLLNTSNIALTLPYIQYPETGSWDPTCDFMVGRSVLQNDLADVSEADEPLTFTHKVGWLSLSFSGFGASQTENVLYVRISHSGSNAMAGDFTVNLTADPQTIDFSGAEDKFIIADYSDKDVTLGALTTYITMFPGTYSSLDIAVKTSNHYITCTRSGLTISEGEVVSATINYQTVNDANGENDTIASNMSGACGVQPSKSNKTDALNVLLLGHSFGIDCTEHLPGLLYNAGLVNVNLCRFHNNDCSLERYWQFICEEGSPQAYYYSVDDGWSSSSSKKVVDKLLDTDWDVIIMQQSTAGFSAPFVGCADYSTYQPYLSLLIEYISTTQKIRRGNTPYLVWNMISSYRSSHAAMYSAIVNATTSMQNEIGFPQILTPGTAIETARTATSYAVDFTNAENYHNLCRADDWHSSYGLGRYLQACTWFQQLFVPIFKAADSEISVVGNAYLPTAYTTEYGTYDQVASERAAALQAIAADTALNNPFHVSE